MRPVISLFAAVFAALLLASPASAAISFDRQWGGMQPGSFNGPNDMATDTAGNVYVADQSNHRVQKFDASGTFLQQWGAIDEFGNPVANSGNGEFCNPIGVVLDSSNNLYVADTCNQRIQKLTVSTSTWSSFGSFGSANGQLCNPSGLGIDAGNNVYVADQCNNRVQKFNSSGGFLAAWGTQGSGNSQFESPVDVVVAPVSAVDRVYVTDYFNNRVQRFSTAGTFQLEFGVPGAGPGEFSGPTSITRDASSAIYVADEHNQRVQKFTTGGVQSDEWGAGGTEDGNFSNPVGVTFGSSSIYVADRSNRIQKFSTTGTFQLKWGATTGHGAGEFLNPYGIAVAPDNTVYVTDWSEHRVQRFSNTGTFMSEFGTQGSVAPGEFSSTRGVAVDSAGKVYVTDAAGRLQRFNASGGAAEVLASGLAEPRGVEVDAAGNIYVTEYSANKIVKYDSSGAPITEWGSFGFGAGRFNGPTGVALDSAGNVYVVEELNHRVQKFTSSGAFLGFIGDYGSGEGEFTNPSDVDVDADDNLYVTDFNNARIEKFRPSGQFIESFGTFGPGNGTFNGPQGIAVDSARRIFVADWANRRVQRLLESDATRPTTNLTGQPDPISNDATPTFTFTTNESGRFECKLDSGDYADCESPKTYSTLADGAHTFSVRAIDDAGNRDATPATYAWVIDTAAPNTSITSGPTGTTGDATPTFEFDSNEDPVTYQCKIDTGAFAACTTPFTTARLADGAHTFSVRAIDAAGSPDPTPATRNFTVATATVQASGGTLSVQGVATDDNLRITKPTPTSFTVSNAAIAGYAGSGLHVGPGCSLVSDRQATCPAAGITALTMGGNDGADRLINDTTLPVTATGGNDDDRLFGGSGRDTLDGGLGADDLSGRGSVDTATYASRSIALAIVIDGIADDGSSEDLDEGGGRKDDVKTDTENVILGSGNDTIRGSTSPNVINGGAGDDVINGYSGADVMDGGPGADDFTGSTAVDTVTYASRTVPVTVTGDGVAFNDGDASDLGAGGKRDNVHSDIETIIGGDANDTITGAGGANNLTGGLGDDTLSGGGAVDMLDGGPGADNLNGGTGVDTTTYATRTGDLDINIVDGLSTDGNAIDDNGTRRDLVGIDVENVIGGSGNDDITGNQTTNTFTGGAGNDVLTGLNGTDTFNGGPGADDFIGGSGFDVATYASSAAGVTVSIDGNTNDGNASDDNVGATRRDNVAADIEDLVGSPFADTLTGSALANVITGGTGQDTLTGLDGNDTLNAFDAFADATINCDGGGSPGSADIAEVDAIDPASIGCETVTTH